MKYRAVLFDMDGTVLNTLDDLTDAVNAAMRNFALHEVSRDTVRANLGNGAGYLIDHVVPEECGDIFKENVCAWYKPYYDAHCRIKTAPYDGIMDLMKKLKAQGVKLAIVSNKPNGAVQVLAEDFFAGMLETSVGESAAIRRKPSPDTVLAAAELMGMCKEECVYVGDSEVDVMTAKNAGMDCIAVDWGFRSRRQLEEAGASVIVSSTDELYEVLK